MLKKIIFSLIVVLLFLFVSYKILSSIPRQKIDKTVTITPPSSPKSQPEKYAFGFQPALTYTEDREPCAEQFAEKKALFGDLHIHTALSSDAYPDGTRTFPDDVYRFAQGQKIDLPVQSGNAPAKIKLARPLDFAAVTDHAEFFGEGYICRTPGAFAGYDTKACEKFRAGGEAGVALFMRHSASINPSRNDDVCGDALKDCLAADDLVWQEVIESAEAAYDRTSTCKFTAFVGYEYTRSTNAMHLHRNTIFRNASVPASPADHQSHPMPYQLLQSLEQDCRQNIEKCDVLSIPHNSNIGGGNSFNPRETEGFSPESIAANQLLRNAFDRLMELTQHKGSSECLNGSTDILGDTDELCNVEAIRAFGKPERAVELNNWLPALFNVDSVECNDTFFESSQNLYKKFCLSSRDFARGALLAGMEVEQDSGVNPYEFGFIGSSDTHIGAAGATDEASWRGHIAYETDLEGRLGDSALGRYNRVASNPGGLAGVYAIENSRDAIFDSMKRREAFATSGTRIEPRFFIGEYSADICDQQEWLKKAYANGTPMGSKLPAQRDGFSLLLQARRDDLSNPLHKLQLIKGWIDGHGHKHNKVIDLVTDTEGANEHCVVWQDQDYHPELPTYYYMRAVEVPSFRWSYQQCQALAPEERPAGCDNDQAEWVSEMAWTSPIWLTPDYKSPAVVQEAGGSHSH